MLCVHISQPAVLRFALQLLIFRRGVVCRLPMRRVTFVMFRKQSQHAGQARVIDQLLLRWRW